MKQPKCLVQKKSIDAQYLERKTEMIEHQFVYACICCFCGCYFCFVLLALTPKQNMQSILIFRLLPFALGVSSLFAAGKLFNLF